MNKLKNAHAGLICPIHNKIDIDYEDYTKQLHQPYSKWKCPKCRMESDFDDDRFDEIHQKESLHD